MPSKDNYIQEIVMKTLLNISQREGGQEGKRTGGKGRGKAKWKGEIGKSRERRRKRRKEGRVAAGSLLSPFPSLRSLLSVTPFHNILPLMISLTLTGMTLVLYIYITDTSAQLNH